MTDFNDIQQKYGNEVLEMQIGAAQPFKSNNLNMRCFKDIEPEPIEWLWESRIALGKVTIIAGDPGLGKSQISAYLAAQVTNGGRLPVDEGNFPLGSAILLNAEDDAADTIHPRLDAVCADLSQVFILDAVNEPSKNQSRSFNLSKDIEQLDIHLSANPSVKLIIIDPLSAYLGGKDSHREADVRGLLAPLSQLAAKHKVAVIAISHLNKSEAKNALQKVTGSLAFVAAARAAYLIAKNPDDPERRVLVPMKNNIGNDNDGFCYSIEAIKLPNGIDTSRIVFENALITKTADEVLSCGQDMHDNTALDEAIQFLEDELSDDGVAAKEIYKRAADAGISTATIKRAKKKLGVGSDKVRDKWVWKLQNKEEEQGVHQN